MGLKAPHANVAAAHGLGPAYAAPETLAVLQALRLIAEAAWSEAAETVLWRIQPMEWALDIASDPRFVRAVEHACETVPNDIRAELDRLAIIPDTEVEMLLEQAAACAREMRANRGPDARINYPSTSAEARRNLEFNRRYALDWIFFRRWRLDDGWLAPMDAEHALEIFHDPLGIAMRRAVVGRLYPGVPFLADDPQPT